MRYWKMIRQTAQAWQEDKASRMAASLAYYSLFSLAPLLLIGTGIAGMVFGEETARKVVIDRLAASVGAMPAAAIGEVLQNAQESGGNTLFTALGFALLLFGASGVFLELQDTLNTIWKVPPRPGLGLLAEVRRRLLSFAIVLGVGLLLLALLAVNFLLVALADFLGPTFTESWLAKSLNLLLPLLVVTVLFSAVYKLLPDTSVRWRDVWLGALVVALMYELGKYGLSLYLTYIFLHSAFGAAGSPLVILSWIYYSSLIFLFGAELSRVCALRRTAVS